MKFDEKEFIHHTQSILNSYDQLGLTNHNRSHFPSWGNIKKLLNRLKEILFPGYYKDFETNADETLHQATQHRIQNAMKQLYKELCRVLKWSGQHPDALSLKTFSQKVTLAFFDYLPELRQQLIEDAQAFYEGDPAAKSETEIIVAYPGFQAITIHRIAHFFYTHGIPLIPRLMSEIVHSETGIDIHPGAKIGRFFCIDHGTGIVIGETAEIGDYVKLYQGVTLGGFSVKKEQANTKRHPTLKNHVTIYAKSTILGGETIIGNHCIIGGNVWLTESLPDHSTVYVSSEKKMKKNA